MIKVRNFLAKNKVFKQSRAPNPILQRVLVIGNGYSLIGGQVLP